MASQVSRRIGAQKKRWSSLSSWTAGLVIGSGVIVATGCLSRPVTPQEPTTKTNFTAVVRQASVDKVDLLFAIDNSASMGDKQDLLRQAVPDLITRLVTPNCVDDMGKPISDGNGTVTTQDGKCAQGKAEFQPVHDMHIGIVSSALGGRGSDQCQAGENPVIKGVDRHNDDRGHLINRGGIDAQGKPGAIDEHAIPDASPSNYLAWFPSVDANKGKNPPSGAVALVGPDPKQLISDFQDMVSGVHEFGCGLEAQLESMYHFLIQPDPYNSIDPDPMDGRRRVLNGVDKDILIQRRDFLREDSLVAIIMLTDEDDSTVDPLSVGGQGWAYENSKFPGSCGGGAARGTSACDKPTVYDNSNPPVAVEGILSDKCTSCGFAGNENDANCQKPGDTCTDPQNPSVQKPQLGYYTAAEDQLNVRFFHMRQRYGVDPQFPIKRYVDGLRSYTVPDRTKEHAGNGKYIGSDPANKNCSNPLFSSNNKDQPLPTDPSNPAALCHMTRGPRTPDLVFFAAISGVPWQMLLQNPADAANSAFKTSLATADWKNILGNDPNSYDYSGVDPHMFQAIKPNDGPRANLPGPTAGDTTDPLHGRDWDSALTDLQYACTFQLPQTKDCNDPKLSPACDCVNGKKPPLCDANGTTQTRGKAYPTIRELTVVRDMADQGIVASLCPRSLDTKNQDYGYRPAVRAIVDRLKNALANQCLPQKLQPTGQSADGSGGGCGDVPCLILETLGVAGPESDCAKFPGLSVPDDLVLKKFREQQKADQGTLGADAGKASDLSSFPVCQVQQLVAGNYKRDATCDGSAKTLHIAYVNDFQYPSGSCAGSSEAGWCYVSGGAAGTCPQAILFSPAGNPQVGSKISLQCIESSGGGSGKATPGAAAAADGGK